jgi:hypothetical protein
MATSSFDKTFVVVDKEAASRFISDVAKPEKVAVHRRNIDAESKRGLASLKRRLSHSVT